MTKTIDFTALEPREIEQQYLYAVTYNETAFRGLRAAYDMYYFYTLEDAQVFVREHLAHHTAYVVLVPVVAQSIPA
jgi:hypothetical protein